MVLTQARTHCGRTKPEEKMRLSKRLVAVLMVAPLALVGCTSSSGGNSGGGSTKAAAGGGGTYGFNFAVVTHGAAGDTFWDVVKKGAEQAGKDEGVKVSYQSDGDPNKQSQLIDAAVNQKVDGIVVSMANPDALKASIEKRRPRASPSSRSTRARHSPKVSERSPTSARTRPSPVRVPARR